MQSSLFVVSDWHLGGAASDEHSAGFQMCMPPGRKRLSAFIRWAADQRTEQRDIHFVVNGDVVDFLAEEKFAAFTSDEVAARTKLQHIIESTSDVWDALRALVASGAALTLLLGNHDLELSLPGPRRMLLDRLGPGRVEFVYDNQALALGPVLIEHGNRYDSWNVISHDVLREVRSALSRGETPPELPPIPGSELVARVMNMFKGRYRFLDLLKPETEAVVPLLATLEPSALDELTKVINLYIKSRRVRFDAQGRPLDPGMIAAGAAVADGEVAEAKKALALARELSQGADEGVIGAVATWLGFWEVWRGAKSKSRDQRLHHLFRGLRHLGDKQSLVFSVNQEIDTYLRPANAAADRGFRVVLFGHTHAPKRVSLNQGALYLNTGTWADLMRLPEAIFGKDEAAAEKELIAFADGLVSGQLDAWREQMPTFARIDLTTDADGKITLDKADLHFFHEPDRVDRVPDGILVRVKP